MPQVIATQTPLPLMEVVRIMPLSPDLELLGQQVITRGLMAMGYSAIMAVQPSPITPSQGMTIVTSTATPPPPPSPTTPFQGIITMASLAGYPPHPSLTTLSQGITVGVSTAATPPPPPSLTTPFQGMALASTAATPPPHPSLTTPSQGMDGMASTATPLPHPSPTTSLQRMAQRAQVTMVFGIILVAPLLITMMSGGMGNMAITITPLAVLLEQTTSLPTLNSSEAATITLIEPLPAEMQV